MTPKETFYWDCTNMAQFYPTSRSSPLPMSPPVFDPWRPGRLSIPGNPANDNGLPIPANDNFPPAVGGGGRRRPPYAALGIATLVLGRNIEEIGNWLLDWIDQWGQLRPRGGGWVKIWEAFPTHVGFIKPYTINGTTWLNNASAPPPFPEAGLWTSVAGLDGQSPLTGNQQDIWAIVHRLTQIVYYTQVGLRSQNVAEYERNALVSRFGPPAASAAYSKVLPSLAKWENPFPNWLPKPGVIWDAPPMPSQVQTPAGDPLWHREGYSSGTGSVARQSNHRRDLGRRWNRQGNQVRHETNVGRGPAGKRTKEAKVKANVNATFIGHVLGEITEFTDLVNALWDALPRQYHSWLPKRLIAKDAPRGFAPVGLDYRVMRLKLLDLYHHWDKVNVAKAVKNVVKNEIGDRMAAGMSKRLTKSWRKAVADGLAPGSPFGPQSGPTL